VRQNSIGVGDGGDDAGNEVILKFKDRFGIKRALVGFRALLRAGGSVHQLHRHPQPPTDLSQIAVHHIARA